MCPYIYYESDILKSRNVNSCACLRWLDVMKWNGMDVWMDWLKRKNEWVLLFSGAHLESIFFFGWSRLGGGLAGVGDKTRPDQAILDTDKTQTRRRRRQD